MRPKTVAVADDARRAEVAAALPFANVVADLTELVADADVVVNGVVGFAGLDVTLATLRAGRRLALANKESLIAAGPVVQPLRSTPGAELVPVDSEHCAVHQCLRSSVTADREVDRIVLTASGGPVPRPATGTSSSTSPSTQALAHPTWKMGPKITVDSSTLMNKGLEVIEAHELFGTSYDQIEVVVHPQSIVHSMVEFTDGATIAQLSLPDMRLPIGYALAYPERIGTPFGRIDWAAAAPARLRAARHRHLPVSRAGLRGRPNRRYRAGVAERGQRGGGRRLPRRTHRLGRHPVDLGVGAGPPRRCAGELPRRHLRGRRGRPSPRDGPAACQRSEPMTVGNMMAGHEEPPVATSESMLRLMAVLVAFGALAWYRWTFALFVVLLIISITLHEYGHYLGARRGGMKATEFFIGFGPRIFSFRRGETEFGFKPILLGRLREGAGDAQPRRGRSGRRATDLPSPVVRPTFRVRVRRSGHEPVDRAGRVLLVLRRASPSTGTSTPALRRWRRWPTARVPLAGVRTDDELIAIDGRQFQGIGEVIEYVHGQGGRTVVLTVRRDGAADRPPRRRRRRESRGCRRRLPRGPVRVGQDGDRPERVRGSPGRVHRVRTSGRWHRRGHRTDLQPVGAVEHVPDGDRSEGGRPDRAGRPRSWASPGRAAAPSRAGSATRSS